MVKGFQKDFLGVHPVGRFNKDKLSQESPTFSSYTGQFQEGRLGPECANGRRVPTGLTHGRSADPSNG